MYLWYIRKEVNQRVVRRTKDQWARNRMRFKNGESIFQGENGKKNQEALFTAQNLKLIPLKLLVSSKE